ncbi:MAG TPA: condensation domain-containing protein, partial [Caldilineaceae bacterium]|nr:condensation domain-containing protein [Caldilineaceae bacterium]
NYMIFQSVHAVDLARHLANGDIEDLGRIDFQVKIRGFRIELGEIENVLAKHPAVRANVVLARTDQDDHKQLVGYIVPQSGHSVTTGELQQFCRQQMPEYMVPAAFVLLDALPLTTNGKIDRRALPAPNQEQRTLSDNFVAPRTREEELLAGIWAEVLGLDRVGIHDNYFELGGDSILSTQVIAKAKALGLTLSLPQLFQHQTIEELARIATSSAPVAPQPTVAPLALLSLADREKLPATVEDAYPLTALQAGMVFHTEQAPDRPVYHDVFSYHLRAPFDQQKLQATLEHLGQCHAVLRTSFALIGFSQPLQLVHPIVRIPLQVEDWRGMSSAEQDAALNEHVQAEARRPFDWSSPPFVRFQLHRRSDDTFNLTISFHHAILDGWSFASLLTDFYQHYYFLLGQKLPPVEPPVLHYREFVALERASANSEEQRAYWLNQLRDHQRAALPRWPQASRTKAGVQSIPIRVPTDLADRLTQLAQLARVPLKSLFLAAHMRVMSVLHNEEDIVTGIALQGRPEALDSEQVKGLFLNTVPFRLKLSGGSWLDLVRATFQAEQASIPFQRFPLAEVQKALGGQPLFETLCFTVHFHVYERLQQLNDFAVLGEKFVQQTNFPLVIGFMQDPLSARLTLVGLDYDPSQFCEAQIRAIGDYHMQALAAMVADPTGKYEDLSLLSPIERQQLLVDWNHTQTVYPQEQTIHALFTAQAERTPAAIALLFAGQPLTYLELEQRANQLARYLQARGVGPEVLVGLCVERSPEMIIAQLAILKAGGAYVPLDPTYPTERLALMLEDTQVKLLLTQAQLAANLPAGPAELIALDSEWPAIAAQPATPLAVAGSPDSLAYVMYTS